jgi:hypothetical protein
LWLRKEVKKMVKIEIGRKNVIPPKLLIDVPDVSGVYETPKGVIKVDMENYSVSNRQSKILLSGEALRGYGKHVNKTDRTVQISSNKALIQLAQDTWLHLTLNNHPLTKWTWELEDRRERLQTLRTQIRMLEELDHERRTEMVVGHPWWA